MATKKKTGTKVATQRECLPAVTNYGDYTGAGTVLDAERIIPQLKVLQALSPQVQEGGPDFVAGAKPGMLFNTGTDVLAIGDEGVIFVPCIRQHLFVEWLPDQGGMVGRMPVDDPRVLKAKAEHDFGKWQTEEGNDLVETFYVFGYTLDAVDATEPGPLFMLVIKGAKIKPYKKAFDKIRSLVLPTPEGNRVNPPMFAHRLHLTTFADTANGKPFFNVGLAFAIDNDRVASLIPADNKDMLDYGADVEAQINTGTMKGATEGDDSAEAPAGKAAF